MRVWPWLGPTTRERCEAAHRGALFHASADSPVYCLAVAGPAPYVHPKENRTYLETELLPVLRQGLAQVLQAVQQERLDMATGNGFPDGYQPDGWHSINPLAMLSKFLRDSCKGT